MQSFIGQRRVSETPKNEGTGLKKIPVIVPFPGTDFIATKKGSRQQLTKQRRRQESCVAGGNLK